VAYYKYSQILHQLNDAAFDSIWKPGTRPEYSGIFRCGGCGKEITHISSEALPSQNHHQHTAVQGDIRWQMIVSHQG
jgi:hypothetical protein